MLSSGGIYPASVYLLAKFLIWNTASGYLVTDEKFLKALFSKKKNLTWKTSSCAPVPVPISKRKYLTSSNTWFEYERLAKVF